MLKFIIETCVHRRAATVFATIVVAIFGVNAYLNTPIEAYPDVTNAQVVVISQFPGYASEEIERQVTVPLERALNGTPGMTLLRSESLFGLSLVTLIFGDDVDPFKARMMVAQRMTDANLPDGVTPVLAPDDTPLGQIYEFRITSDRHDLYQLRSEMQWNVTRVLRQVEGVADVLPFGGYLKEIHVEADPEKLRASGVTIAELEESINKGNLNVGGGFLRHGDQELTIRGIGFIETAEDIKKIPLKAGEGLSLTVGDVATVKMAATPRRGAIGWNNQREAIHGFVIMRRGENPSRVLDGVHHQIDVLNSSILPAGMKLVPFLDRSDLVTHTLSTVHDNLLHGFLLVVAVVWLFLRTAIGSSIVAVVIPLALLVAFIGLHAIGLPANLISMGAIDFGILVDGAVVLVERVTHAIAEQKPRDRRALLQLVITSAVDVGRPTLYAMSIIIAALIPVFTLESVEGRIFRPLALTYAFALVGALVFSLTVVPALCAFLFRTSHTSREPAWIDKLRHFYRGLLELALAKRLRPILAGVVLVVAGGFAVSRVGTEFLPELDEGDFDIVVEMPASIALAKGQDLLAEVRKRVLEFPEVTQILSQQGRPEDGTDNEGVNMSENYVRLKPKDEWRPDWDKERLVQAMRASLVQIPGLRFNFSAPIKDNVEESVSGVRGKVVLKIFGEDLAKMRATLEEAKAALKDIPGITDLDLYRDATTPQLRVELDRGALAHAGVPVRDAARGIETALSGRVVTQFWEGERPVPVRLMYPKGVRDDQEKIAQLPIDTASGTSVPLRQVAQLKVENGVASIVREGNIRFLALKFNVEGRDMGSVVRDATAAVAAHVKPPDGHYFQWGGEFENQARAVRRLEIVVPIAVLLVLGLLYAAMNSGRSALAILATVPFSLSGGAFALLVAGIPLSVSAVIGFIALLGQVSLMGVLVLSATETRRRAGEPLLTALLDGASERLRAVLMASTLAMLGLLPMALSTGVGSETQRPFALVVVGGMITTLFVALFVLPAIYTFITTATLKTPEELDA
jgi:heavy metal efflux system protein